MFEKIYTYSDVDRKYNRIRGIGGTVLMILFLFPMFGMLCNLFSCYVLYLSPSRHRMVYYIFTAILAIMLIKSVVTWVNEMFTVYAIDKRGKVYRFKMIAFALEYLGIGDKVREAAGTATTGRTGRFMAVYGMLVKMRESIEKLKNETELEELIMQGCAAEIKFESVVRTGYGIKCSTDRGTIKIRKVYMDSDNLLGYIEFYCTNKCETGIFRDYAPSKKSALEQIVTGKNYFQRVAGKSYWVIGISLWLLLLVCSGDIGRQAQINNGNYKSVDAKCVNVQRSGSNYRYSFEYEVDGQKYIKNIKGGQNSYKTGDTKEYYYNVKSHDKSFYFANESHINAKPVMVIFLVCELIVILVSMDFEELNKQKQ